MPNCIEFLAGLSGKWEGAGINHEGQSYNGQLVIDVPVNKQATILHFVAKGSDGAVYHSETLMVGVEHNGNTIAYSASNNIPGLAAFVVTYSTQNLVFTLGDLNDPETFREVITLRLEQDGQLFHGFSWAMPGEQMQERSAARLALVD